MQAKNATKFSILQRVPTCSQVINKPKNKVLFYSCESARNVSFGFVNDVHKLHSCLSDTRDQVGGVAPGRDTQLARKPLKNHATISQNIC